MNVNIPYTPFPYQVSFHQDTARFRVIAGGRRVGKSKCMLHELVRHCLSTSNALAWWVSPTYKDAREIGFEELETLFDVLEPAIQVINRTNLSVKFVNGSKILFKGSDHEDSLRGRGLTAVGIDEAAFVKEDTWKKVLRPALSDRKGTAIFTSTPNGRNWFHDLYQNAAYPSRRSTWNAYHWPTSVNPLIGEDEIAEARDGLSSTDFRQEYLAEFINRAGMVYDEFSDLNVVNSLDLSPTTMDFYLSMDFGFANPTAVVFMAIERTTGIVYQFDELYLTRVSLDGIEEMVRSVLMKHRLSAADITCIYTDPAGNAEELSSGLSPVDMLRKKGWIVQNKGSRIIPGLAMVRSFIRSESGIIKYFITSNCKETIRSIKGYHYKDNPWGVYKEEPDKDNLNDHCCDSVRYFFVNHFDQAKYVTYSIDQQPTGVAARQKKVFKRCSKCGSPFMSETARDVRPFLCKECRLK